MGGLLHYYYLVCFGIDLKREDADFFSQYDEHKSALASNKAMSMTVISAADVAITIWSLCNLWLRLSHDHDSAGLKAYLVALVAINIFAIFFVIVLFALAVCTIKSAYLFNLQLLFQDLWVVLLTGRLCLTMVGKVWVGSCHLDSSHDFYCNPLDQSNSLPAALSTILILLPSLVSSCMDGVHLYAVLTVWLSVLCTLIISSAMLGWSAALIQLVLYYSVPSLIMVHRHEQQRLLVFVKSRFEASVKEMERQGKESRATEIRRMISFVAHDIKTVRIRDVMLVQKISIEF